MHIETLRDKLACEIAEATYIKYQSEVYGLKACKSCLTDFEIQTKIMLKDILDNYTNCLSCDLDKIKDLH